MLAFGCKLFIWVATLQEGGAAMSFRYTISLKAKTHCYYPKALESGVDWMDLRSGMLGAAFDNMYQKVPNQEHARIIWEVLWMSS